MISSPLIYLLNTHGVFMLYILVLGYLWFIEKSYEETKHVIVAALVTTCVVLLLKEVFSIPRPYEQLSLEPLAGFSVRTDSLPSLHAALAFCLSATVILHQKKFGLILILIAILISYGRVAAYVHYPIDVMLGSAIGIVVSLAVEHVKIKS